MNWEEIHSALKGLIEQQYPFTAVAACNANPELARPHLLAALQAAITDPASVSDESSEQTFIYAAFLLIQWREPAAFNILLAAARLEDHVLNELFGDDYMLLLAQGLAACSTELAPLITLAHDRSASMWARSCAIDAMALRVNEGDLPKDEAVHQFRLMAAPWTVDLEAMQVRGLNESDADYEALSWLIQMLCYAAKDIDAQEMQDECIAWCDAGYFSDANETPESIRRMFIESKSNIFAQAYLQDAAAEMCEWHFFQSDAIRAERSQILRKLTARIPTMKREHAKIGRNDPCPCGSGKKYKKCCGA